MKVKRAFKGKDSAMITKLSLMMKFFEDQLADFTAFDPNLNAAFLQNWKLAYEQLNTVLGWGQHGDERETKEEFFLLKGANQTLRKCRAKYKDVKYFAGLAFPQNAEVLRQFGEGTYSKVSYSHLKMVPFMEMLFGVATKYKTDLIAHGYTQAAIDQIETLTAQLRTENQLQQLKKKERPTETRNRIEALNTFYSFGQRVHDAAQEVHRDSEALRHEFRLALSHHPKQKKRWFTVGVHQTHKTGLKRLQKNYNITLTNQGPYEIEYWLANQATDVPINPKTLRPGESVQFVTPYFIPAEEMQRLPRFLLTQNSSMKPVRLMLALDKKVNPLEGREEN